MSQAHRSSGEGDAGSRRMDLLLVLLGVLGLLAKRHIASGLVHSYGGNFAASFATVFLLKLPSVPKRFRSAAAAVLALVAVELFEATNGFGVMTNTFDPADYLANAVGVAFAVLVDGVLRFAPGFRGASNEPRSA